MSLNEQEAKQVLTMYSNAVSCIGDLVGQRFTLERRIAELEAELASKPPVEAPDGYSIRVLPHSAVVLKSRPTRYDFEEAGFSNTVELAEFLETFEVDVFEPSERG